MPSMAEGCMRSLSAFDDFCTELPRPLIKGKGTSGRFAVDHSGMGVWGKALRDYRADDGRGKTRACIRASGFQHRANAAPTWTRNYYL